MMLFFDEILSNTLQYKLQPYAEAMVMCPTVSCTPYSISSGEQTDDKIMFAQFEEGGLLFETCNDAESGDLSVDNSIMPSLISE